MCGTLKQTRNALLLALALSTNVAAQDTSPYQTPLWESIPQNEPSTGTALLAVNASSARYDRLNDSKLQQVLQLAPVDTGATESHPGVEIELPVPGRLLPRRYERFRVLESPIVPPELIPHLGGLKTYTGRGIDNPTLTTRFSVTPAGLSGIVIGPEGTWIIEALPEPDQSGGTSRRTHATVYKEEIRMRHRHRIPAMRMTGNTAELLRAPTRPRAIMNSFQPERRTFRIAVAATPGYTEYHRSRASAPISDDAARDSALVAIVETINMVQALYERELAIRFEFVPKQRDIIFVSNTGGYPGDDVSDALLNRNQVVVDSAIGSENYDLGHVFTKADGGVGAIASICEDGRKALGATGWEDPTAEKYFAIDFVAHEIGHQMNGRHTFNSAQGGSCTIGTRDEPDAFEPGSGTTIMAYAGICNDSHTNSDVEYESDQYFHVASLQRIAENLSYIDVQYPTCGRRKPTGNNAPNVTTKSEWVIPAGTPFVLHASGSDPDGDSLTYTWEEYYPDPTWAPVPSPPDEADEGTLRPSFRSYPPSRNPTRTLPRLEHLMFGEPSSYERLPRTTRSAEGDRPLSFRVTARDTRGAFATSDVTIHVITAIADEPVEPFTVSRPTSNTRVVRGTDTDVRWSYMNTDVAPIQCTNVRILLASDRSRGFVDTLAASTANDGIERVRVPDGPPTLDAWIRVECVDNIFFNVSRRFRLRQ